MRVYSILINKLNYLLKINIYFFFTINARLKFIYFYFNYLNECGIIQNSKLLSKPMKNEFFKKRKKIIKTYF